MSANTAKQRTPDVDPKGKQRKRFLGKDDALSLASSIAALQEKKSQIRSEKRQKDQALNASLGHDAKQISDSKSKLKEIKAILRARTAEAKKQRARSRKERLKGSEGRSETPSQPINIKSEKNKRKTVSFA
ncbi:hypothetical protein CVT26_012273 [Gymnopilus dilepis]|uniref:Uncharacterized protein n=1 Tax=Gymnopilus dilepis TaxID=231916 RepID=A0A409YQA5_9AGAR|nr:hypothetical protein CVT26_012273 [Gymnopilus dilepis]